MPVSDQKLIYRDKELEEASLVILVVFCETKLSDLLISNEDIIKMELISHCTLCLPVLV